MNYLIADANLDLRSDWRNYVREPEAPSNYKDPDKIAEYKTKKLLALEEEVTENAPSVLLVSNPKFAYSGEGNPSGDTLEEKLWRILPVEDELVFVGNKAILYAMYGEVMDRDSLFVKDIRRALFNKKIRFTTLEEIRFTPGDRKYLILEKLMPRRYRDETDLRYAVRMMNLWGVVQDQNWVYF